MPLIHSAAPGSINKTKNEVFCPPQTILMKLPLRLLLSTALISLLFSACQREIKNDVPAPGPGSGTGLVLNATPVNANLTGVVLDENGAPVSGALVKAGGQTVNTNARGNFRFDGIQLDKYSAVVKVEKAGYFLGIRTFSATANNTNFVRIKLIPKVEAGSFSATAGGSVTVGGSVITIPASAVVLKSNNQPYSGTVRVFAANIDPTQNDISLIVPGSFQATDANNFRVALKSYGMIAVELEGGGGEPLQIASGKKATLKMTIPSSLQGSAPSTMPLWYMNETDGLWKEEGTATRSGNTYEGEVSHFSFWNLDVANDPIFLEMTLQTSEGPLRYATVRITRISNGSSAYGYTDTSGHVGGLVFKDEPLLLEVVDNCQTVIYSQNIGPFSSATNLGTLTVTIPAVNELQVSGTAVDCNNQPVNNGRALIYFENALFQVPVLNGAFSLQMTRCANSSGSVEVTVIDEASSQQSFPVVASASSGIYTTGTIQACGNSSVQYVNYSIDGGAEINLSSATGLDSITARFVQGTIFDVSAFKTNQPDTTLWFTFVGNTTGSFPVNLRDINTYVSISPVTPFNVNVTTMGAPGQFVEGNFNGQFKEGPNATVHTINCIFRVRRLN